jgi:hypothetical protein
VIVSDGGDWKIKKKEVYTSALNAASRLRGAEGK